MYGIEAFVVVQTGNRYVTGLYVQQILCVTFQTINLWIIRANFILNYPFVTIDEVNKISRKT
jgi:hypothetical protein